MTVNIELTNIRQCRNCQKEIGQSHNPNDLKWYHKEDGCVSCVRVLTFAEPGGNAEMKPITAEPVVDWLFTNGAGELTRYLNRTEEVSHGDVVYSSIAREDVLAKLVEFEKSVRERERQEIKAQEEINDWKNQRP